MRIAALAVLLLLAPAVAHADRTLGGTVFVDRDGDGVLSASDPVFTNGVVFWETSRHVEIDARGMYSLTVPDHAGIVWVLGRGGLDPGPFWAHVPEGSEQIIDIAVRTGSVAGEFTFVVASDTHAGSAHLSAPDQAFVLRQATNLEPRPYFLAVTGDITQSNRPEQFAIVHEAVAAIETPYVPVPGNHDWYDGGVAYRRHFGPPSYAFQAGGMGFLVLNDADSMDTRVRFTAQVAELLAGASPMVALMHAPPRDELVEALAAVGVKYLLTGHLHANRLLVHDDLVEYNTQPLAMGGIDLTPAGYRVFSLDAEGMLRSDHRTIVNQPVLRIVSPVTGQIVRPCHVPVIVGLEAGAPVSAIEVRAPGLASAPLTYIGGWNHASAPLRVCTPGVHTLTVEAALADGTVLTDTVEVSVGTPRAAGTVRDWPMLQGGPDHQGSSPIETGFPLHTQWVAAVGGHVQGGSPVVAGGRVFVAVSDFGQGARGGVVALGAHTGRMLWEQRVGFSVRNAPAVADDIVVFAANNGTVHAVDAASGATRWTYALAAGVEPASRNLYASPVIAAGVVYVAARRELAALALRTGEILWSVAPMDSWGDLASHATPAVALDLLLVAFDRGDDGLLAFDRETGERVWQTGPEIVQGMQGSPVIAGETVYVVNETTQVTAVDLLDGSIRWSRQLDDQGFGCAITPWPRPHMTMVSCSWAHSLARCMRCTRALAACCGLPGPRTP